MPDRRTHRGPHPRDRALFAEQQLEKLREAAANYRWLLSRGYNGVSALKLVGDRFQLVQRQRMALERASAPGSTSAARRARRLCLAQLGGQAVSVDGFNCLITVEVALGGGVLLGSCDGSTRDLASVHGTYRRVTETPAALGLLCDALKAAPAGPVTWYLDSPVSNSGRLASTMREHFASQELGWQVELVKNADRAIIASGAVAASSDSALLDACPAWLDLAGTVIRERVPEAWWVELRALPRVAKPAAPWQGSGRG